MFNGIAHMWTGINSMFIHPASPNGLGNRSSLLFRTSNQTNGKKELVLSNHNHTQCSIPPLKCRRRMAEYGSHSSHPTFWIPFKYSPHHTRYSQPMYYIGNSWWNCKMLLMMGSALGKLNWGELDPLSNIHGFLAHYRNKVLWWAGVAAAGYREDSLCKQPSFFWDNLFILF